MHQNIIDFLIEVPPIEEIGGKISYVIEQYRAGTLTKKACVDKIIEDYYPFIQEYIKHSEFIKRQLLPTIF